MARKTYYKNLDTIRFIAAFFVIIYHWFPQKIGDFPLAKIGVDIFFVLSGFLITEILLNEKVKQKNKSTILIAFYIKRSIRIFPIYFLFLLFFYYYNYPDLGKNWIYFFTYTVNFFIYNKQEWVHPISHLWSLAVEEQFYLCWPFIIIFARFRYHLQLIVVTIFLSLISIIFISKWNSFYHLLPTSCMSTLGIGALLACLKLEYGKYYSFLVKGSSYLLILSLTMFGLFYFLRLDYIFMHIVIAIFSFSLISFSISTQNSIYNKVASNSLTSFLGKVSYGLYLFHHPIPWLVRNLNGSEISHTIRLPKILPLFTNGYYILIENFICLLVISITSWIIIEKPLNSFKRYFN